MVSPSKNLDGTAILQQMSLLLGKKVQQELNREEGLQVARSDALEPPSSKKLLSRMDGESPDRPSARRDTSTVERKFVNYQRDSGSKRDASIGIEVFNPADDVPDDNDEESNGRHSNIQNRDSSMHLARANQYRY